MQPWDATLMKNCHIVDVSSAFQQTSGLGDEYSEIGSTWTLELMREPL